MTILALQVIWFILVGVVIAGYALLGGYDMGVGAAYLFDRSEKDRFQMMRTIGPYWGANQIWLVTAGGGLFAAFPFVFATVFSGFYLAMVLVLVGLIIRTIGVEFRHQMDTPTWNKVWDAGFGIGSILVSILLGVATGNVLRGIPLDVDTNYAGSFFGLLSPYAVLMGVLSLALFAWHGANYLIATSDSPLKNKASGWSKNAWMAVAALMVILTGWTFAASPHLTVNFKNMPLLYVAPLVAFAGIALYPVLKTKMPCCGAIASSALAILGMVGTAGASLFPRLVPNLNSVGEYNPTAFADFTSSHLADSLTIMNASSSQFTLTVMFIVAAIGVPTVLLYTIYVYVKMGKSNPEPELAATTPASIPGKKGKSKKSRG